MTAIPILELREVGSVRAVHVSKRFARTAY
jgi:hypothetical protein